MNLDDHVWNLASKKLAREASDEELRELNALLAKNPELHSQLKLMSKWWDEGEEKPENQGLALFDKIQAKIKDIEGTAPVEIAGMGSELKKVQTPVANRNSNKN